MSVYTIDHVIDECSSDQSIFNSKNSILPSAKQAIYTDSWNALNLWIESRLTQRKGASVPMLGTFTWDFKRKDGEVQFRPIFILGDSFLKDHLVKRPRVHKMPLVAPSEEINYSNLAIKYSKGLTKDMAFTGVRDVLKKIGQYFDRVYEFEIQFTFGTLKSKERRIKFEFDQSRISELLPQNLSSDKLFMPQDYQFSDEPDVPEPPPQASRLALSLPKRPSTSQSQSSEYGTARSDRYDTLTGQDSWQATKFYHSTKPSAAPTGLKKTTQSRSAVRLEPLSESGYLDTGRAESAQSDMYSPGSPATRTGGGGYSERDAYSQSAPSSSDYGSYTANSEAQDTQQYESEEPFMSPRLQEIVLQIEAKERSQGMVKQASNSRYAREKAVEEAYLRCLREAEDAARYNDQVHEAGLNAVQAWTRRDHKKMEKAKIESKELRATLDQQSAEAKERMMKESIDRRNAKMAFFLPENAGKFSLPLEGDQGELTESMRRERFCQDLAYQIKSKAESAARAKREKMVEEREYLDHIAVELDMQQAMERANHLEKQQILLEAWEKDAHIRNLKGLSTKGVPSVTTYINNNLPDVATLKKSAMMSSSIGFDSRRSAR